MVDLNKELIKYVKKNDFGKVLRYFERGANANSVDGRGKSALHYAVLNQSTEMCEWLIDNGADPNNFAVHPAYYPILMAIKLNDIKLIEYLIRNGALLKIDISKNISDVIGCNPLNMISEDGLNYMVDPIRNAINIDNSSESIIRTVKTLIEYGAVVTEFALNDAIVYKKKEVVEFFLSEGINQEPSSKNNSRTSVGEAIRMNEPEILRLLLENGADANCITEEGTELYKAVEAKNYECAKILLEYGADVNFEALFSETYGSFEDDPDGYEEIEEWTLPSPFMLAIKNGNQKIVELMLGHGAELNKKLKETSFSIYHDCIMCGIRDDIDDNEFANIEWSVNDCRLPKNLSVITKEYQFANISPAEYLHLIIKLFDAIARKYKGELLRFGKIFNEKYTPMYHHIISNGAYIREKIQKIDFEKIDISSGQWSTLKFVNGKRKDGYKPLKKQR